MQEIDRMINFTSSIQQEPLTRNVLTPVERSRYFWINMQVEMLLVCELFIACFDLLISPLYEVILHYGISDVYDKLSWKTR